MKAHPSPSTPPSNNAPRLTLLHPVSATTTIKRSRFTATASPVPSAPAAASFISLHSDAKASHNCWAYRLSATDFRSSDDGEPAGTAGAPMLGVLAGGNFVRVAVVVARHFGGIKLGAGGLARAYARAVAACLADAQTAECARTVEATVTAAFEDVGRVFEVAERYSRVDAEFSAEGARVIVRMRVEERGAFEEAVRDAARGRALVKFGEEGDEEGG